MARRVAIQAADGDARKVRIKEHPLQAGGGAVGKPDKVVRRPLCPLNGERGATRPGGFGEDEKLSPLNGFLGPGRPDTDWTAGPGERPRSDRPALRARHRHGFVGAQPCGGRACVVVSCFAMAVRSSASAPGSDRVMAVSSMVAVA